MDTVIDLKEDIRNYLAENNMTLTEREIDLIAVEFNERIDMCETQEDTTVERGSTKYTKLLVEAIREVANRTKDVVYTEAVRDVVEDDYSEESDAEFKL